MFAEPRIGGEAAALRASDLFSHLRTQDTSKEILCQWGNRECPEHTSGDPLKRLHEIV